MGTTCPVISRISGVRSLDPAVWRQLAAHGSDFYAGLPWLAAQEDFSGEPQRLLVAERNGAVSAVLPYAVPDREFNPFYEPSALWGEQAPAAAELVHLGVGRGYDNPVLLEPATRPDGERAALVAALAAEVARLVAETGRPAVAQYVRAPRLDTAAALLGGTAAVLPVALNAVIPLQGTGFDDYLRTFTGPRASRRRKIGYERRRFEAAGYQVGTEELRDCRDELAPLLVQLQHRHGQSASAPSTARLILSQAEHLDGTVFTCRRDGDLLGFCLVYRWHDALHVRMAGFDYPRLAGAFEYFNLTTYLPIDHAYRYGLREVHLGMESYRAKVLRGAELVPMVTALGPGAVADPTALRAAAWRRVAGWQDEVPDPAGAFDIPELSKEATACPTG
ncbi:GNAT family N-acetyltransferase [Streptomyces sp. NPDC005423]|uniref:GNAT family N-acetyltransferase n=1 Tax=Streptomyces sp. NPDC005423 TaxID=3155343 RepID=UPI00339FBF2B